MSTKLETEPERKSGRDPHDVSVVLVGLFLIAVGGLAFRAMTQPQLQEFRLRGLSFERPVGFLPPTPVPRATSALALAAEPTLDEPAPTDPQDAGPQDAGPQDAGPTPESATPRKPAYHVVYQAPGSPLLRLEVRIAPRPVYNNLIGALSIYRTGRFGSSYWASNTAMHNIGGRDWTRTEFRYAHRASQMDSPRVASAIEYAALNGDWLYAVTFHGSEGQVTELAEIIAPTLTLRAIEP